MHAEATDRIAVPASHAAAALSANGAASEMQSLRAGSRRAGGRRAWRGMLALAAAAWLAGCASGYRYRYEPLPAVIGVTTSQGPRDLALVSVLGAITPEGSDRDEIHVRFRLQNATRQPLRLPLDAQHLLTGDLLDFTSARLVAGETVAAPGAAVIADVAFGYPDGESPNLRGLTLGWTLEVEGSRIGGTTAFQKLQPESMYGPYDPWPWGPYGPYGGPGHGAGWHGSHGHHIH